MIGVRPRPPARQFGGGRDRDDPEKLLLVVRVWDDIVETLKNKGPEGITSEQRDALRWLHDWATCDYSFNDDNYIVRTPQGIILRLDRIDRKDSNRFLNYVFGIDELYSYTGDSTNLKKK